MDVQQLFEFVSNLVNSQVLWTFIAIVVIAYIKNMFEKAIQEAKQDLKNEREEAKAERKKAYEILNNFASAINKLTYRVDGVETSIRKLEDKINKVI